MASYTPNLNLVLPIGVEKVSRTIINSNNTIIDGAIGGINTKITPVSLGASTLAGVKTALINLNSGMTNYTDRAVYFALSSTDGVFTANVPYIGILHRQDANNFSCNVQGKSGQNITLGYDNGTWTIDSPKDEVATLNSKIENKYISTPTTLVSLVQSTPTTGESYWYSDVQSNITDIPSGINLGYYLQISIQRFNLEAKIHIAGTNGEYTFYYNNGTISNVDNINLDHLITQSNITFDGLCDKFDTLHTNSPFLFSMNSANSNTLCGQSGTGMGIGKITDTAIIFAYFQPAAKILTFGSIVPSTQVVTVYGKVTGV